MVASERGDWVGLLSIGGLAVEEQGGLPSFDGVAEVGSLRGARSFVAYGAASVLFPISRVPIPVYSFLQMCLVMVGLA